jgi:hypothetical protein
VRIRDVAISRDRRLEYLGALPCEGRAHRLIVEVEFETTSIEEAQAAQFLVGAEVRILPVEAIHDKPLSPPPVETVECEVIEPHQLPPPSSPMPTFHLACCGVSVTTDSAVVYCPRCYLRYEADKLARQLPEQGS